MKKVILSLAVLTATSLLADATALYKPCAGCHGAKAEKKALGKSKVIAGWKSADVVKALEGYKAGTYGGAMKGVMKGQVAKLSADDMKALGTLIEGMK